MEEQFGLLLGAFSVILALIFFPGNMLNKEF
jgi:hypothetical protein